MVRHCTFSQRHTRGSCKHEVASSARSLIAIGTGVTYPLTSGGLSSDHCWEKDNQDYLPNLWCVLIIQYSYKGTRQVLNFDTNSRWVLVQSSSNSTPSRIRGIRNRPMPGANPLMDLLPSSSSPSPKSE